MRKGRVHVLRRYYSAAIPRLRAMSIRRGIWTRCTVLPYETVDSAIVLARRGGGSLVGSVFTADDRMAARLVLGWRRSMAASSL